VAPAIRILPYVAGRSEGGQDSVRGGGGGEGEVPMSLSYRKPRKGLPIFIKEERERKRERRKKPRGQPEARESFNHCPTSQLYRKGKKGKKNKPSGGENKREM